MPVTATKLDASPLPFLHLLEKLKHLDRTGWKRWLQHPESVASHMYRLSFLVLFAPEGVDKQKAIWIALCHDVAEAMAGDIPTFVRMPKDEKYKLEELGMQYIESLLQLAAPQLAADIRAAWLEYESGNTEDATPTGRWLREMDKFECLIQAHEYEQRTYGEENLGEFQGQVSHILSIEGKEMLEVLQQERQAHFQKRLQRTPVIFVIGTPSADMKTQCERLSKKAGYQHISLPEVLRERSEHETYFHNEFLGSCLKAKARVPDDVAIDLLEWKINEGLKEGKKWSLVWGFPETMDQLVAFKRKVQKSNYTLFLNCISEETVGESQVRGGDVLDVINDLKGEAEYFKEIPGNGSVDEVYALFEKATEEFIHGEAQSPHV